MSMIDAMYAGKIKGLTCGPEPACSLPNSISPEGVAEP